MTGAGALFRGSFPVLFAEPHNFSRALQVPLEAPS